jgi:hypothetical protein
VGWLALSAVVGMTTAVQALRARAAFDDPQPIVTPGLDFHTLVWAPVRGVLAGFNPYQTPADPEYLARFGPALPSSPRPPSLLLLEAPLALPTSPVGFVGSVVLHCLLLWAGMVLLSRARTRHELLLLAVLGSAVVLSGPADMMLGLGQVSAWAVLGVGLMLRYPHGWWGGVGLSLVLVVPQFGLGLSVLLLALGQLGLVARGWAVMIVLSLPALVPSVLAAGGADEFVASALRNITLQSTPGNAVNRIDIGGLLTQAPGLALGLGVAAILACAVFLALVRPPLDHVLLLALSCLLVVSFYGMPYHLPIPLALAVAAIVRPGASRLVRATAGVFVTTSALTSFWLVPVWDAGGTLTNVVWSLLMVSFTAVPAMLVFVALADVSSRNQDVPAGTEARHR